MSNLDYTLPTQDNNTGSTRYQLTTNRALKCRELIDTQINAVIDTADLDEPRALTALARRCVELNAAWEAQAELLDSGLIPTATETAADAAQVRLLEQELDEPADVHTYVCKCSEVYGDTGAGWEYVEAGQCQPAGTHCWCCGRALPPATPTRGRTLDEVLGAPDAAYRRYYGSEQAYAEARNQAAREDSTSFAGLAQNGLLERLEVVLPATGAGVWN